MKGRVKWFSESKGYGFIACEEEGKQDVFVHHSGIEMDGFKTLGQGQFVEFEEEQTDRGVKAVNVRVVDSPPDQD